MAGQAPRGRFAPTPNGPLHFGSLVTAIGSYLSVRSRSGQWLVRMEDLDPPREQAGAAATILRTLESYGLTWDEEVIYQSQRSERYQAAIDQLLAKDLAYYCRCSRKDIEQTALTGTEGFRYPGTCRHLRLRGKNHSLRIMVPDEVIAVHDRLQGELRQNLLQDIGDFIVRRSDGLYSYQLAVVIDDAAQRITEVCRGTDLMDSAPRQVYLQQALGYPIPEYMHLPIAADASGQKLSKQNFASAVSDGDSNTLVRALEFLGQTVPRELVRAPPVELLQWGVDSWDISMIPTSKLIRTDFE